MALQLVQASGAKRVDASVMPDIGTRTAVAAEFDVVEMACLPTRNTPMSSCWLR
jgi:hypothetical protein